MEAATIECDAEKFKKAFPESFSPSQGDLPNIPDDSKTTPDEQSMLLADWRAYPISYQKWVKIPDNGYNRETGLSRDQVEMLYEYGLVLRARDRNQFAYWLPSMIKAKHEAKSKLETSDFQALVLMSNWNNYITEKG